MAHAEDENSQVTAAQARLTFNIPAQSLESALKLFARQSGGQLIYGGLDLSPYQAPTVRGSMTYVEALSRLLSSSRIEFRLRDGNVAVLRERPDPSVQESHTLQQVNVVGTFEEERERVYQTPGSAGVVTREQIDRLPPRNTSDVVENVSGVYTSQSRQNPGVSVNVRGMQDFGRVTVMVDGARQNFQKSGHGSNGLVYVDPELLSGVDVFKGPVSTVGGAGSIAGTVNFKTLDADDLLEEGERAGGRLNLNSGDNGYHFAGSLAAAFRPTDNFDMTAAISRKNLGDYERGARGIPDDSPDYMHGVSQFTGQEQWSGLFKTRWRFAPDQSLEFSYVGMRADYSESYQDTSLQDNQRGDNEARTDTLTAHYHQGGGENLLLNLNASLYYTLTRVNEKRWGSNYYDDFAVEYETNTVGGTLTNRSVFPFKRFDLALDYGTEFYYDWTDPQAQSQSDDSQSSSEWFTGATPEGERWVSSVFTEATFQHDDWLKLIAGLRYDWYQIKGDGRIFNGLIPNPEGVRPPYTRMYTNFDVERHAGAFAPKLTLSLSPYRWLEIYASYGEGLRPPAITESLLSGAHVGNMFFYYPNPGLEEERSRNWEIGTNLKWDGLLARGDTLRTKIAWFDSTVENYMVQGAIMTPVDEKQPNGFSGFAFVNLDDDVRFRGLELETDYDAGWVFGGVSYTRMLIDMGKGGYDPFPLGSIYGYPDTVFGDPNGYNGGYVWYVLPPRHRVLANLGVRLFNRKLTLGTQFRYERPTDAQSDAGWVSDSAIDSWRTWDLWARYDLTDNATLRLSVNNLRDTYYTEMNGGSYQVGTGRTVIGGISIRF
ncbi:TonB-dependent heme/hemoglobin receptor family protein [Alloalcanivorax dieselolei B5]|uniref:TonB-dependent heme/hemoglobin receptor family protein n=1 Tax=Alcanivorax dieselolei (strain DSM 16502 / CGMCC 1.3690 / MCCC 1A00001 / B-5) TaxID=930169 RepID=K0CDE8_ALCDB|nr:TonB-dependent hemoglobin/transferrin/lactoferrin family receptor [Alloalcanivorax dieselolei]AFT71634.1 TonB-dependent heme/hemoglobin receptor family protein [Alloalcanivorax dieselolei B5]GGJ89259.1 heme uptake outer membrane receptor HasR [Alloalcanivorax dieselolei]